MSWSAFLPFTSRETDRTAATVVNTWTVDNRDTNDKIVINYLCLECKSIPVYLHVYLPVQSYA